MILSKAHRAPYAAHPGVKKMHTNLRHLYHWARMHRDIAEFAAQCLEYQRVKIKHQHPTRLFYPHEILKWKLDTISMDFMVGFPLSTCRHDAIMVTMDKLTKVGYFSLVWNTYTEPIVAMVFVDVKVCRQQPHGKLSHWGDLCA